MTIRILVNAALLAIPIAVTLGILFGLQSHRAATGQPPLFAPEPPPIPSPKPPAPPKNGVTKTRYCQKSFGITPDTEGQQYTCRCRLKCPWKCAVAQSTNSRWPRWMQPRRYKLILDYFTWFWRGLLCFDAAALTMDLSWMSANHL